MSSPIWGVQVSPITCNDTLPKACCAGSVRGLGSGEDRPPLPTMLALMGSPSTWLFPPSSRKSVPASVSGWVRNQGNVARKLAVCCFVLCSTPINLLMNLNLRCDSLWSKAVSPHVTNEGFNDLDPGYPASAEQNKKVKQDSQAAFVSIKRTDYAGTLHPFICQDFNFKDLCCNSHAMTDGSYFTNYSLKLR